MIGDGNQKDPEIQAFNDEKYGVPIVLFFL